MVCWRRIGVGFVGWMLALLLVMPAMAAGIVKTDVHIGRAQEQVVFHGTAPLAVTKHFQLQNPPRLVVDIAKVSHGKGVGLSSQYQGALLHQVRFGQYNASTSRLVMDLRVDKISYALEKRAGGAQLVLTLKALKGARQVSSSFGVTPTAKPDKAVSQARKPMIVIDAGHGGKDSGAIGSSGAYEKHITLKYTKLLRDALLKTGRYRVALTRSGDRYLFLKDRVKIARDHKADIFISLHADSSPNPKAEGLSVYTVSEKASDAEAAALAAQENRADIIGGIDLGDADGAVADILIDLAQRETKNKGSELADLIVKMMHPKVPLLTNPHRFAGFRVLKAPDIPSVLIEVGFLSSSKDEYRLKSKEYQGKVIQSLIKALDAYLKEDHSINQAK